MNLITLKSPNFTPMKFSMTRKINLANIDEKLFGYETEDIAVEGADSFEEACQMLDRLVAERVGFYKARSQEGRKVVPGPVNITPSVPAPAPSSTSGSVSNQPPADLA